MRSSFYIHIHKLSTFKLHITSKGHCRVSEKWIRNGSLLRPTLNPTISIITCTYIRSLHTQQSHPPIHPSVYTCSLQFVLFLKKHYDIWEYLSIRFSPSYPTMHPYHPSSNQSPSLTEPRENYRAKEKNHLLRKVPNQDQQLRSGDLPYGLLAARLRPCIEGCWSWVAGRRGGLQMWWSG